MAEIRAFTGLRYNPQIAGDLGQLICPPYDVISRDQQKALYDRSPYNMIRLEYGMVFSDDAPGHDRDSRAARDYLDWKRDGVLKRDSQPAIYIHDHYFEYHGNKRRRGILARVRLETEGNRTILPHEHTVAGVKSDRLQLMKACSANFSPIFILYDDSSGQMGAALDRYTMTEPTVECRVPEGDVHKVWAVTDEKLNSMARKVMGGQISYIADGHHRYETCQAYREEQQALSSSTTGEEGYCFMLMTLIPFSDPGLFVLPIHRLLKGLSKQSIELIRSLLVRYFDIREIETKGSGRSDVYLERAGAQIAVAGLVADHLLLCKLKSATTLEKLMPANRSEAYRSLPVSLLHHLILDHVVEVKSGVVDLSYTHEEDEALTKLGSGSCQLAFVLPPTPVATIKAIADSGDRMPGKSTFFYPKLPTGLVINPLDS
jgi:uncharacterized protein (DUF1015 family)